MKNIENLDNEHISRSINDLLLNNNQPVDFTNSYTNTTLFEGDYRVLFQPPTGSFIFYHTSSIHKEFNLLFDLLPQFIILHFQFDGNFWGNFVNGNEYNFNAGEHNIFVVGKDYSTQNLFLQQEKMNFCSIYIPMNVFEKYLSMEDIFFALYTEKRKSEQSFMLFEQNLPINLTVGNLLKDFFSSKQSGIFKSLYMEAKIMEILASQLQQYAAKNQKPETANKQSIKDADIEKLHTVKEVLQNTFLQSYSLQSIAKMGGINEFKLKKGFKEIFGNTVFGYLADLKMEYAKEKLVQKKASISEISDEIGFQHPQHFSQAFKKKYGYSPSQYFNNNSLVAY
jgi:AraC-like DNA-binding protein